MEKLECLSYIINIVEEDKCFLYVGSSAGELLSATRRENVHDILVSFLNKKYIPEIIDYDCLERKGAFSKWDLTREDVVSLLDSWDHVEVMSCVRALYETDDKFVNALKPSERHCAYLSFLSKPQNIKNTTQGSSDDREMSSGACFTQPVFDKGVFVIEAGHLGLVFMEMVDAIKSARRVNEDTARYLAACEVAARRKLRLTKNVQYRFDSTRDFVLWLLNYTIDNNRYIKKCKYCGMYFGSTRSDATFCGVTCANGFNAQIGIYDNPEINRLYKRIVSALRVRIESRDKQGLAYIRKYDPTLAKVDLDAWKDAFHKEYRERTKELKNLKQTSKRDQFDRKVSELQIWLEAALAQVHNFIPEQLTE